MSGEGVHASPIIPCQPQPGQAKPAFLTTCGSGFLHARAHPCPPRGTSTHACSRPHLHLVCTRERAGRRYWEGGGRILDGTEALAVPTLATMPPWGGTGLRPKEVPRESERARERLYQSPPDLQTHTLSISRARHLGTARASLRALKKSFEHVGWERQEQMCVSGVSLPPP